MDAHPPAKPCPGNLTIDDLSSVTGLSCIFDEGHIGACRCPIGDRVIRWTGGRMKAPVHLTTDERCSFLEGYIMGLEQRIVALEAQTLGAIVRDYAREHPDWVKQLKARKAGASA